MGVSWYRLEVDVLDDIAQAVVVMFNETATALVKCSTDSLMDTADEELRTVWVPALMDVEDSDTKDSGDSANGTGKKEAL
ncbi:hypothetical protein Tco_0533858 [Tanacetum coccineum]